MGASVQKDTYSVSDTNDSVLSEQLEDSVMRFICSSTEHLCAVGDITVIFKCRNRMVVVVPSNNNAENILK